MIQISVKKCPAAQKLYDEFMESSEIKTLIQENQVCFVLMYRFSIFFVILMSIIDLFFIIFFLVKVYHAVSMSKSMCANVLYSLNVLTVFMFQSYHTFL